MLNPFPIQYLALFGYFILRVFLGWILFRQGYRLVFNTYTSENKKSTPRWLIWTFGTVEMVIGLQFILGFLTQIAALVTIIISIAIIITPQTQLRKHIPETSFWILVIGVCLCLFITGAGVFAYDLPI